MRGLHTVSLRVFQLPDRSNLFFFLKRVRHLLSVGENPRGQVALLTVHAKSNHRHSPSEGRDCHYASFTQYEHKCKVPSWYLLLLRTAKRSAPYLTGSSFIRMLSTDSHLRRSSPCTLLVIISRRIPCSRMGSISNSSRAKDRSLKNQKLVAISNPPGLKPAFGGRSSTPATHRSVARFSSYGV